MPRSHDLVLRLDPDPGSIDGHVGGVIEVPQGLLQAAELDIELFCTRFVLGGNKSSSTLVWQDKATFAVQTGASGMTRVPFCFYLPPEAPTSGEPAASYHVWTLATSAGDFARRWEVPVLASGAHASPPIAALVASVPPANVLDQALHLTRDASGFTMDYPAGHNASGVSYMFVFGVGICGAACLMNHQEGRLSFMQVLCWLLGLPVIAGGLWMLGNSLRVELRYGSLLIRRRFFGWHVKTKQIALERIAGLTVVKSAWSMQGGRDPQLFYALKVESLDDGSSHTAGESFVGYSAARHAAHRMAELLGLKTLYGPSAGTVIDHVERPASPARPPSNTFVDKLLDDRKGIARYRYASQAVGAFFFLASGLLFGLPQIPLLLHGTVTTGVIVDSKVFQSKDRTSYHPVIEFEVDDSKVRFQATWGRSSPALQGEPVSVIYDADNPDEAMADEGARNWIPWAPCLAVGVLLAIAALRSWLASLRSRRQGRPV